MTPWQPLLSRAQRTGAVRRYHKGRAALIAEMGGGCIECGTTADLQFHHRQPRTWVANKTSRWQRLAHYRREWREGVIDLRCGTCNKKSGKPKGNYDDIPF